jgi:hypothetical protein
MTAMASSCGIVQTHNFLFLGHPIKGLTYKMKTFSSMIYFWRISYVKAALLGTLKILDHLNLSLLAWPAPTPLLWKP